MGFLCSFLQVEVLFRDLFSFPFFFHFSLLWLVRWLGGNEKEKKGCKNIIV